MGQRVAKAETELLLSSPVGAEVLMYGRVEGIATLQTLCKQSLLADSLRSSGLFLGSDENQPDSFKVLLLPISQVKSTLC